MAAALVGPSRLPDACVRPDCALLLGRGVFSLDVPWTEGNYTKRRDTFYQKERGDMEKNMGYSSDSSNRASGEQEKKNAGHAWKCQSPSG